KLFFYPEIQLVKGWVTLRVERAVVGNVDACFGVVDCADNRSRGIAAHQPKARSYLPTPPQRHAACQRQDMGLVLIEKPPLLVAIASLAPRKRIGAVAEEARIGGDFQRELGPPNTTFTVVHKVGRPVDGYDTMPKALVKPFDA